MFRNILILMSNTLKPSLSALHLWQKSPFVSCGPGFGHRLRHPPTTRSNTPGSPNARLSWCFCFAGQQRGELDFSTITAVPGGYYSFSTPTKTQEMNGNYNLPRDANKRNSVVLEIDFFGGCHANIWDLLVH